MIFSLNTQSIRRKEGCAMRQFKKILSFEMKNYFGNKLFMGITIFIVVLIAGVLFFPRIMGFVGNGDPNSSADLPVMLIVSNKIEDAEQLKEAFSPAFSDYTVNVSEDGIDDVKEQIMDGKVDCAFYIDDLTSFTYYVNNLSIDDTNELIATEVLRNMYRISAMVAGGFSLESAVAIQTISIDSKTESLGKNQVHNFFYTYIMIFALYLVILLYGQMVATSVASEKSSRAMELLITSAEPSSMMFGKVIAACLAGLTQLAAIFGSTLFFYRINMDYWQDNLIVESLFGMPADLFGYLMVFFILGFLIYAFLYGAIGSIVSKLEDINTSVMPITILFVGSFLVVILSMVNVGVDTALMKISSFIPFISPMAMFTRIAMSTVTDVEIFVSIGILLVSVVGIGVLAARIYKVGVMLYGTPPKFGSLIKSLFET